MRKKINTPTMFTLSRLVVAPLFLPIIFVYVLPLNNEWLNYFLALLFVSFGLTDFFDGYLARRLQQETPLGKVLDPIADKFLVYSTLIALLAVDKINFYWVLLFIGREFFVMALRIIALENGLSVNVSWVGKSKTLFQMAALTVVIANPYQALSMNEAFHWNSIQMSLLTIALFLSLVSAWLYYRDSLRAFRHKMHTHVPRERDEAPIEPEIVHRDDSDTTSDV